MYIDYKMLGKRISQRRRELGYKQHELAEKANISNNYLSNIENGKSIPSLLTFVTICICLQTTPDNFLLGVARTNNISQNLLENLKLCNTASLNLLEGIVECILKEQNRKN